MTRPLTVVGGEALIDLVPGDGPTSTVHLGGGPFNAARTIARLGQRASFLGCISTDAYGRKLLAALDDDGVETDAVIRTDAPTTLALAEPVDGTTRYRFYHEGTSAPRLGVAHARRCTPRDVAAILVGTLGLVIEPMATALEAVVSDAPDHTSVVVDPNCRPAASPDVAAYRARLERVLHRTDVLKLSAEDLAWLNPGEPIVSATRGLLGDRTSCAVVTSGADGTLVVMREGAVERVPAARARVVDTIGAGDAFVGALIAWWSDRGLGRTAWSDRAAVVAGARFASLVAARTCERAGADPPRLRELPGDRRYGRDEAETATGATGR